MQERWSSEYTHDKHERMHGNTSYRSAIDHREPATSIVRVQEGRRQNCDIVLIDSGINTGCSVQG